MIVLKKIGPGQDPFICTRLRKAPPLPRGTVLLQKPDGTVLGGSVTHAAAPGEVCRLPVTLG